MNFIKKTNLPNTVVKNNKALAIYDRNAPDLMMCDVCCRDADVSDSYYIIRRGYTGKQENWICDNCWRRKKKHFTSHGWKATHYIKNQTGSYDEFIEEIENPDDLPDDEIPDSDDDYDNGWIHNDEDEEDEDEEDEDDDEEDEYIKDQKLKSILDKVDIWESMSKPTSTIHKNDSVTLCDDLIRDEVMTFNDIMTLDEVKVLEIHNKLERIFETIGHIYNNITDKNKQWYENVRIFIKYHIDILNEIDGEEEDTDEDNIITQKGFEYFIGEKCADIDEDEFDGPNDLSMEEWWDIDNIILYYYNKL